MYEEVFEGMNYTNDEIAEMFNKSFERPGKDTSDMVLVKDIEVFSYCEHHMALMYDMHVSVAYIPKGKCSDLARSHGLQIWSQNAYSCRKESVPISHIL